MAKASDGSNSPVSRRGFLTAGASGAAALAAGIPDAPAQQTSAPISGSASTPSPAQLARDTGTVRPPDIERAAQAPGSDLMVDVLRGLGVEYVSSNPGSSFEALQESLINHGNPPNRMPEFITALHEMSAVDMASGYGRAEGRPMAALLHGTLGIQNASMAIYQAFSGRIPVLLLVGRDDSFMQAHTADDMAAMVRGFTKWDAQPRTLDESLKAIQQAYAMAMTPPRGPVLVVLDTELQKEEAPGRKAPAALSLTLQGVSADQGRMIARRLMEAENPRIQVGQLRTPEGVRLAVELAELVGACTGTAATNGSMSFPQRHPLCGAGARTDYDFTLGLEADGAQVAIKGPRLVSLLDRDRNSAKIGFGMMRNRPSGQPGQPGQPGSAARGAMDISGDAEASLPHILEEARSLMTNERRAVIGRRSLSHAQANHAARIADLKVALESKRAGWDASPVSTARLYADLWPLIKDEDWCLSSPSIFSGSHHVQLWEHNKPYSYLGLQPAGGMGYGLGQSVGAALAARDRGRIVINIQCDGDLNYSPGALWTAAHHRLPLLTIMHNNRAWHQEFMYVQYMTGVRGRGTDRGHIGTTLRDPYISYAKMAEGYGMASEGPISDPTRLAAAYRRGIASVKRGEPYLIDVITQPR